eukprot:COSAG02_NODE_1764_length_11026_cov_4.823465_9_plen_44_part_00
MNPAVFCSMSHRLGWNRVHDVKLTDKYCAPLFDDHLESLLVFG